MNLTRALDVALPEIPARTLAERYPRMDPGTTFQEHIEDGKPVVRIYAPGSGLMYKFPAEIWALVQHFDGKRNYQEVAALYSRQTGQDYGADQVREIAGDLETSGFWYKTPQEKNILLMQQSSEDRKKTLKVKSRYADISMILFPAFNPDYYLTKLYNVTYWIYTPWFTVLTLFFFAFSFGITVVHWQEIGRDTVQFYNFADKSWSDILGLYALAMFVVAAHEYAHAHACKHYGARVPAMGFALVFLTPAFYTDTTEGVVKATRWQRLIISLAGIWVELMICSIATPIWWLTPPQTPVHDCAYFIMLLTGLTSLLINWNPLIKLDGYHMLCEVLGISDLKESSTAYVAAWNKRYIWRLPVEVPYVPKSRRLGFAVYALLSGGYSYMILCFVARFAGNVFRNFSPEWSFIPVIAAAALIFRSRIRLLVNLMKFVYLDKKDRVRAWLQPGRVLVIAAGTLMLTLLPVWRDSSSGRFVLRPVNDAIVRTAVPGMVVKVYTAEGQQVAAGAPLMTLRNLPLQAQVLRARADYDLAASRATSAVLRYSNIGQTASNRDRMGKEGQELALEATKLEVLSPISGVVMTPRVQDRLGSYVKEGVELLEVADVSRMRARIYISEYDLNKCKVGAPGRVQVDGAWKKWNATVSAITPDALELDPSLSEANKLKGLNPPKFYVVDLLVDNSDGRLRPGMTGLARIYAGKRSLLAMAWETTSNFAGRKLW
jgi:putative peptide zinc metalloprotease protein